VRMGAVALVSMAWGIDASSCGQDQSTCDAQVSLIQGSLFFSQGWKKMLSSQVACTSFSFPGYYLLGFANGDSRSLGLDEAMSDCVSSGEGCEGVTCDAVGGCTLRQGTTMSLSSSGETSHLKVCGLPPTCSFSVAAGQYLPGYADSDSRSTNLNAAMNDCVADGSGCDGVTCDASGGCTVRRGTTLTPSPSGEVSFVKTCTTETATCTAFNYPGYYLSGYASNNSIINGFTQTMKDCIADGKQCDGVTCDVKGGCTVRQGTNLLPSPSSEISYLKVCNLAPGCTYSEGHFGYFLPGLADNDSGTTGLEQAMIDCIAGGAGCAGVTCNTSGGCGARKGVTLTSSESGEISYMKTCHLTV